MTPEAAQPVRTEVKQVLARNAAWNYIGFAVNLFTNLLLFPFVVAYLGETASGIWLLLGSLTGYMGLFELGIVPSLTQHVAAAVGAGARAELNRAASTALLVLTAMMAVVFQALWLVPLLVEMLRIPPALTADAHVIFAVSFAGFALRMPLATFQALLLGCQRQDRCNQLWIGLALVKAIATMVLLLLGLGVVAIVVMEALAHLCAGVLQARWVREELPDLRLSWRFADRLHARALVSLGGALLLMNLCALVIEQTDRLVIAAFLPLAHVTHYSAAWKLYMLAVSLPMILLHAVAPMAGHLHGRGETQALRTLFLRMTKYSAAIGLPVTVGVALSSGVILQFWMGPAFVDARAPAQVLLVAFAVTVFNHAGYSTLLGTRRVGPLLWLYYVPQAALNLVLSVLLVQRLGTVGVALGTMLPALLLEYPFLRYVLRQADVSLRAFLTEAVRPAAWPLPFAFFPLVVAYVAAGPLWPPLVPVAGASVLAYAALFWLRALEPAERRELALLIRGRLWRVAAQGS